MKRKKGVIGKGYPNVEGVPVPLGPLSTHLMFILYVHNNVVKPAENADSELL